MDLFLTIVGEEFADAFMAGIAALSSSWFWFLIIKIYVIMNIVIVAGTFIGNVLSPKKLFQTGSNGRFLPSAHNYKLANIFQLMAVDITWFLPGVLYQRIVLFIIGVWEFIKILFFNIIYFIKDEMTFLLTIVFICPVSIIRAVRSKLTADDLLKAEQARHKVAKKRAAFQKKRKR